MANCDIVVREFELKSCYFVHFRTNILRKSMNSLIPPAIGSIVPLLFFYKDGLDIKKPMKVSMPVNKRSQTKQKIKTEALKEQLLCIFVFFK